jgi:hypothetical protein
LENLIILIRLMDILWFASFMEMFGLLYYFNFYSTNNQTDWFGTWQLFHQALNISFYTHGISLFVVFNIVILELMNCVKYTFLTRHQRHFIVDTTLIQNMKLFVTLFQSWNDIVCQLGLFCDCMSSNCSVSEML